MNLVLIVLGVAALAAGGEALVRGALAGARRLRVSPLLVGLVVVGFGTSLPELVVSVDAALSARPDIAIGNVIGSNIGNVLLILGVCAVIAPLTVRPLALRRDALTVVAASVAFIVLAWGHALGRGDAAILFAGLVAYVAWTYATERRARGDPAATLRRAEADEVVAVPTSLGWTAALLVAGLTALIGGSRVLLSGAVGLAADLGVPEAAIGLTLVAVGTSLPELSVSVIAALRRHADVAVGNVLGSNVFNLLGILGVSALLQPLPIAARVVQFDQWVMLGAAVLLALFLLTGRRLSRWEGGVLLVAYVGYVVFGFTSFAT